MDPKKFKSQMGDLALGSALGAAARDYKKELEAQYKAQSRAAAPAHEDVDFDELMDDPELEKLHAERIASMKENCALEYSLCGCLYFQKEAEKRLALSQKGDGEYREEQSILMESLKSGSQATSLPGTRLRGLARIVFCGFS